MCWFQKNRGRLLGVGVGQQRSTWHNCSGKSSLTGTCRRRSHLVCKPGEGVTGAWLGLPGVFTWMIPNLLEVELLTPPSLHPVVEDWGGVFLDPSHSVPGAVPILLSLPPWSPVPASTLANGPWLVSPHHPGSLRPLSMQLPERGLQTYLASCPPDPFTGFPLHMAFLLKRPCTAFPDQVQPQRACLPWRLRPFSPSAHLPGLPLCPRSASCTSTLEACCPVSYGFPLRCPPSAVSLSVGHL